MKIRVAMLPLCPAAALPLPTLVFLGQVPWPFPLRPSPAVPDDGDMRREGGGATLAVATGSGPDAGPGMQVLVDPDGFIRARPAAGQPEGWDNAVTLLAQVGRIRARPVTFNGGDDAQNR